MVSSLMDEEHIKQLLKAPATYEYINALQAGAAGALMDLYDRKVTRDEMAEGMQRCLILYGQCAKLYMLKNIETVYKGGTLDQPTFTKAETELTDFIRRHSEAVIDMVKRLEMCADDGEPIH